MVLSRRAGSLAAHGFYWPNSTTGQPKDIKDIGSFAGSLKTHNLGKEMHSRQEMVGFFQESLRLQRNIIISSEVFEEVDSAGAKMLHELLAGFDTRIVYVYRETLAHLISLHFELNRFEHRSLQYSVPFSDYLIARMDSGVSRVVKPLQTIDTFAAHFGKDSMRIIDMAGCEAVGLDLAYVLLCEVAGIMCGDQAKFGGSRNVGYDLIVAEVFSHYKAHVETRNHGHCKFCNGAYAEYNIFRRDHTTFLTEHTSLPVITSRLGLLVPYSQQVDSELRAAYEGQMLHANRTANYLAMKNEVEVRQLDNVKFVTSAYWVDWIQGVYKKASGKKRLCECAEERKGWLW
jgi:hypothetical protein